MCLGIPGRVLSIRDDRGLPCPAGVYLARLVTRRDYQILMARLASDSTAMARLQAAGHH